MESARRVGLPPAYEDADIDALCQLIGTCDLIQKNKIIINLHTTTALMLDRLISINDRIPLSPCVSTHALLSIPTHPDLIYPFFSYIFFPIFCMACPSYFRDFSWRTYRHDPMMPGSPHPGRAYHVSTLRPYRRSPFSIISGASYALPISRCAFLRLLPLHHPSLHPAKRTWLTSTFPPLRRIDHRRPAYSSSYTTSTKSARANQHSLYPP
jgi:hypothetical protein